MNEFKKMQKLAGIITESQLNEDMALSNQELKAKSEITGKSIMNIYNMMSEIDDMDSIQEIGFIISNKDWSNRDEFSTKQKIYREIQKHIDDKAMVNDLNTLFGTTVGDSIIFRSTNRSLNEVELENYMFFSNLKQMKRQIEMMMEMDPVMVDNILQNCHDWADDHISEAKNNMDQVFDFLKNEMDKSYSLNEEVYGGQSVDRGETGSSIEFEVKENTPEYYTIDYTITPNSKYSSRSAARNYVRTKKSGTARIKKNYDAPSEWITVEGDSFLVGKQFEKEIFGDKAD
jgi:hypothetical protein